MESSKESQGRLTEELTEGQRKGYSLHRLQEREREGEGLWESFSFRILRKQEERNPSV